MRLENIATDDYVNVFAMAKRQNWHNVTREKSF